MTYDEALKEIEIIVKSLEQAEALSMEEYKKQAQRARELLDYCEQQLKTMETEFKQV